MKYSNIREEELKNKVASDYFDVFDCTRIIGNVDFCVSVPHKGHSLFEQDSLLWAEAKRGDSNIYHSIVQLILTIGKARTFDKVMPPNMLGALDGGRIAFIPYNEIHDVFYINDFNWNVTPSDYTTKEFNLVLGKVTHVLDNKALLFDFMKDERELKAFIKQNFVVGRYGLTKTRIDKNNFVVIYNKWLQTVKPTIVVNWDVAKKGGIIDGDFYLADLLSKENQTLKDKLFVLLQNDHYELDRHMDSAGLFTSKRTEFKDNQVAHIQFWNKYERPPKEEYWDYIVERRDLLVPQDVRERKGSFFTPQIWVELSQKYLTDALGEDWQDEYYVWDCAAGTGNLLNGLTNKYNIWASTLDKQDVEVMHDRIKNGANLLPDHVFQFDFLNDDFEKLPKPLKAIIDDSEKRKKLVVYINPPYAEATSAKTVSGTGENKSGVSKKHSANDHFRDKIGNAVNELFALFMAQVYEKLDNCILGQFSKLKFIQGTNFTSFKKFFKAEFLGGFVVPADSFDNVKGSFPIAFTLWNLNNLHAIKDITCDVYTKDGTFSGEKAFYAELPQNINRWIKNFDTKESFGLAYMGNPSPDFQHNNQLYISLKKGIEHFNFWVYTQSNIFMGAIYFAVRHSIAANWLNDRDQFLFPVNLNSFAQDFQTDCLAFTLLHSQNRISYRDGTNKWIPYNEYEVESTEKFESNFMSQFIQGKLKSDVSTDLFGAKIPGSEPLVFSPEATEVMNAGRELWRYYHKQPGCNVNASLYDIREHFQGRNEAGKMNNRSDDPIYTELIGALRDKLKLLAKKIEPKVYEYGFLKG